MGKRGPLPTPTPILKARGSWLAKTRPNEPRPERGRPPCPRWLSVEARRIWRTTVPLLEKMGVLSRVDGNALARYCVYLGWWRREIAFLEEHGSTYPSQRGDAVLFKTFPAVRVVDMLSTQLNRLEQAFGLTPSARTRIEVESQEEMNDEHDKQRFLRLG